MNSKTYIGNQAWSSTLDSYKLLYQLDIMVCIRLFYIAIVFSFLFSCSTKTARIKNENKGDLKAIYKLEEIRTKKIILDSDTAPKPQYIQIYTDSIGTRNFTFLNTYANSIYFYNYETLEFINKITYDKKGPDGIPMPLGYHIKNMDSIYVYNYINLELVLTNSNSRVLKKISLTGGQDFRKSSNTLLYYPQFLPETSTPFMETSKELLLPAQYTRTIPDSLISKIKFLERIDLKTNEVEFNHTYPPLLYGHDYNWDDEMFTEVFPQLHPDGDKLIYSFPVSHDLYITGLNSNGYRKVYGGSNFASSIRSISKDSKRVSREELVSHIIKQDLYAVIKYDKYRKVYYRFLRKGIPNATVRTQIKEKPIAVIMMDENFGYLGETVIGTSEKWHWQNSFVTEEGLNIEYLEEDDIDEVDLTLKIFVPKTIEQI